MELYGLNSSNLAQGRPRPKSHHHRRRRHKFIIGPGERCPKRGRIMKWKPELHSPKENSHPEDKPPADAISICVQRLQIAHVPVPTSAGADARHMLDRLLKDGIDFVPATTATAGTEPVRKQLLREHTLHGQAGQRSQLIAHISTSCARPDLGATGLVNPTGVLCYRRSCLQLLMNLPVFVNWIKLHGTSPRYRCPMSNCPACALRNLADAYWPPGVARRSSTVVNRAVRNFDLVVNRLPRCPGAAGCEQLRQQDAHEFLLFVLDSLAPACMPRAELEALFGLKRLPRRTCRACGYQESQEPVVWLHANVNLRHPAPSLAFKDYFDQFFYETFRDVQCARCARLVHDRKQVVVAAPEVLLVQLVRFDCDPVGRHRKLNDPVSFPLHLDLSEYLDHDSPDCMPRVAVRYRLAAILQHAGDINTGHYTAKVVSPKGIQDVNDHVVVEKPSTTAELLRRRDGCFTPYVLAYIKASE